MENVFSIIKRVKLIKKKKFAIVALNSEYKIFIVYIATFSLNLGDKMHPLIKAQIAYLKVDKAFTKVSRKYTDFVDVFSRKLVAKLLKYMSIYNCIIKLVDNW